MFKPMTPARMRKRQNALTGLITSPKSTLEMTVVSSVPMPLQIA
eukprot:CAMPEP_0185175386 /NCGR_PEP_ID=MMETSP1139-20130426/26689_1 /TAXON_ID=298111 /ORGANISM="Pavlova sp., Strain CCMP459" /LENGTH=43 /DNA_ID= /DNA_START= /DNA_END= /DNA_ORIENTATION=